ncbi:MAG TPA: hypothetical protein VN946_05890 [Terriglobales bacterium]|jgi:hypothetical protein|nr:hypothetical protein [Terriglobales bacterium]
MEKLRFTFSFVAMIAAASLAMSCGASQEQSQLRSITLSPATADAQNYPDGQVPFAATGHYVNPSQTITPQTANWVACQQNAPTTQVSVTTSGVAQCTKGATGTYSITAWDTVNTPGTVNCPAMTACGGGCTAAATAQLTCP